MKAPAVDSALSVEAGFTFGSYRLEPDGTLFHENAPVHLPAKELGLLRLLLQRAGQIVTPGQLRQALWGGVHVTDDSVPRSISSLRARLESEDCIQTVYKQGYRFTWPVQRDEGPSESGLPRLAIVPFACGPTVPEHMGHAVAQDVTARLTAMRPQAFAILARDSSFALAKKGMSAQQVGEALKADQVLTGTVQAVGSHFRLRMEMVSVHDGTQVWVEDVLVDRERADGLQTEVVARLLFRAGAEASGVLPADDKSGMDARAYDLFLRGRYEWQSLERHRMQEGIRCLHQASELEPRLTACRVEMVRACVAQELFGFAAPVTAAEQVRGIAQRLREYPSEYQSILPAVGWMTFHVERNLASALRMFSQNEELAFEPWNTRMRALLAASRHRFSEACELLKNALELDPYSAWLNAALAWVYHLGGSSEESMRQMGRCLELAPDHTATRLYGGVILAFNGDAEQAIELTRELARNTPNFDMAMAVHAYALACVGERGKAGNWLERLQWLSRERFVMRSFAAPAFLALGDRDGAMGELRAADEDRCPWFFQMLADPRLADLASVPEFQKMQGRLQQMEIAAGTGIRDEAEVSAACAK